MNNLFFFLNSSPYGIGIYGRRKTDVPAPAATVGFMEARVFQTLWTNDTWGTLPDHGELKGYHEKLAYFNVLYTDGHSSFTDFGNGTFYERLPENQGLDARGTWGRLDTLPASRLTVIPPLADTAPGAKPITGTLISRILRADR
jgi:hypothetical protein